MNTQTEVTEEKYPESWDDLETAKEEGSKFLKVESGTQVNVRVVQGPKAFAQLYEKDIRLEGDTEKSKFFTLTLPFGTKLPGYKLRNSFAFEVVVLSGKAKGKHKIWAAGQKVAEQLQKIARKWGTIRACDIEIEKEGEGLTTKWSVTAGPQSEGHYKPEFNLENEIEFSKESDIRKLPQPQSSKKNQIGGATKAQFDKIINLIAIKDLTSLQIEEILQTRFKKIELEQLNPQEADALYEVLKGM